MTTLERDNLLRVLTEIVTDVEADASATGRTIGEYFGNHGAAIAALATVLKVVCHELRDLEADHAPSSDAPPYA